MESILGASGRTYAALPIDASRGFPQAFPVLFRGRTYQFQLYVNVPAARIQRATGTYRARTNLVEQLDGNVTSTLLKVVSVEGFPQNTPFAARLDDEIVSVAGIAGTSWTVERGAQGSKAAAHAVDAPVEYSTSTLDLPLPDAHLVVKVDVEKASGAREPLFARKAITGLEYETGDIALLFSTLRVAVSNMNGRGDFGSLVIGGIAPRWA